MPRRTDTLLEESTMATTTDRPKNKLNPTEALVLATFDYRFWTIGDLQEALYWFDDPDEVRSAAKWLVRRGMLQRVDTHQASPPIYMITQFGMRVVRDHRVARGPAMRVLDGGRS